VAWVSPKSLQPSALLQQLQGSLPDYMLPTAVVLMEELPLMVSEKVDRKSLPAPDFATDMVTLAAAAPAAAAAAGDQHTGLAACSLDAGTVDSLTLFVSAVWGEVLGLKPLAVLGAAEDFFGLGGNSLLAGEFLTRVALMLGIGKGVSHPAAGCLEGYLCPVIRVWLRWLPEAPDLCMQIAQLQGICCLVVAP
jgi:hypothetical protein